MSPEEEVYVFPASYAQRRLWFADRMEPGSPLYNLPVAWRLRGPLDPGALARALNGVAARHEALRTTFEVEESEPVQVVHPHRPRYPRRCPLVDLSGPREAEVRHVLAAEASRPFDLARGPLFRSLLVHLAPDDHILLAVFHHIVADGRSLAIFARELGTLYAGAPLPDLPIQYADFALWQRDRAGEMEEQLAWWRERLAGAPPVQELPFAGARPAVRDRRGAARTHLLPAAPALEAVGRREGATPFVALLAAFQALLFRLTPFSGRTDVVVGTPIDNRAGEETEGLIGLFVNTLVLRTDLGGDPTFRGLLARVRAAALEAYAHQDLPFERLVEALRPERDLGHDPLVQVIFGLQEGTGGLRLSGLDVEPLEVHHGRVKLDLAVSVERGTGARVDYDVQLFDAAAAGRLLDAYAALVEGAAADPDAPLSALPVLGEAARHQVLTEWNDTGVHPEQGSVHGAFEAWARRTPDAPALIAEGGTVTYGELNARADRLARHLIVQGVRPESKVAVVMRHSPERVVALLAVLKAGGAYVSLDPADPEERRAAMLADCGARVVMGPHPPAPSPAPPESPAPGEGETCGCPDALAYVIYTSGSTGRPKGVEVPHRGLLALVRWHRRAYGVTPVDRAPQMAGEGFDASVWELWPYLLSGAAVVFPPEGVRANPAALVPWLAGAGITLAFLPTPVAELALDEPWPASPGNRLRALLVGGDRLRRRPGPVHRFQLVNHYGPTESSVVATWGAVAAAGSGAPSIGRPVDGTRACVLDGRGRPVPAGVAGELCLGGESLARGYLGRPDLTAECFVPDPRGEGERLYRTGDLVRHRADGEIEFLGRIDHQVKIRGVRVEPGEIEAALAAHPDVREAVVAVRERGGEARLVAYVVLSGSVPGAAGRVPASAGRVPGLPGTLPIPPGILPGPTGTLPAAPGTLPVSPGTLPGPPGTLPVSSETLPGGSRTLLRDWLKVRLPAAMVPSAVVILDALPLTPNGKVDLRALVEPEWEEGTGEGFAAPRTPAEELLAAIWAEVLGEVRDRSPVGIHDGFFDLGGHSLLATQVVSRVRRVFGVELPLRAVFEAPTVAGLAARIDAARQGEPVPPIQPVPRGGELPASFAQERLWFLDQLGDPGDVGAVYNVPAGLRLRGRLSVPSLAAALNGIVRRHEALRTTFALADEARVVQIVSPAPDLALPIVDLRGMPEEETLRVAAAEAARPFDLARGPLLRVLLLRTGEEDHLLVLAMHHIVADGWTLGVLLRELARLYAGASLPPLALQYADYAAWQRGWLRGEPLQRQLDFWRGRLNGLPPLLELPTDRPRPPVQGTRGGRVDLDFDLDGLEALCRARGVTLFMALLAGVQALLGRITGREDPPVGTPIANRQRAETEAVAGLFVNTLALPADLAGDPAFMDLLARVRETTLDAYAHQDLPFEKLVEELRPERGLSHAPVFQVMLVVQNAPFAPPAFAGLDAEPVDLDTGTAKLDLMLGLVDRSDRRILRAEYSRDLFDRTTVVRLLDALAGLLAAAAADPGLRLSDLPLLSEAGRQQALVEWNDTAAVRRERCLHDLVAAQAARTPRAVAVACQGERVTYAELMARARRIAAHLQRLGVGSERPVGVCLERTPDLVAALLAILQAGGVYVPLDPAYPAERLAFLLEDCGRGWEEPLVVTREPLLARLPEPVRSVCLDRDDVTVLTGEAPAAVLPDHLAYLIYTSGSTGRPKAVAIEHRSATALVDWAAEVFLPEDLAGVLASTSINFDLSVFELFVPLALGGTVILADDALALAGLPEAEQVTLVNTVPSAMAGLLRLEALPRSVRTVNLAGEPLAPALVAEIEAKTSARVLDLYGPSEDTTYSTSARRRGDEPATIGRPLSNGRAHLLDRWQRPAAAGAPGEIWLGGAGLARGYLHRPDLTAERFVPDPFGGEPGGRLYRTGDLARFRADGCLELLGRIDHQVKLRGFRIELGEVETHVLAFPGVHEAAVLALGEGAERRLVAFVVVEPHPLSPSPGGRGGTHLEGYLYDPAVPPQPGSPSPGGGWEGDGRGGQGVRSLRAWLESRLPSHMVPSAFGFLESLPRLPNGKLDRRALAALPVNGAGAAEGFVAPAAEDEVRLAAIWSEVLGVPRVGLHDDFFRLGGHSLLATRIVARVRRDFGVDLPLRSLFQEPTVARLLGAVREAKAVEAPRIATLSRSASNLRSRSGIGRREGP
ncbi:MAG TPA: amino acid adenylation domain-containing protein [Thermoanaerobaculia bacterium]|nr:amino acid adenylation domain-containing protein [Thermoanaerobaculia bacterium]